MFTKSAEDLHSSSLTAVATSETLYCGFHVKTFKIKRKKMSKKSDDHLVTVYTRYIYTMKSTVISTIISITISTKSKILSTMSKLLSTISIISTMISTISMFVCPSIPAQLRAKERLDFLRLVKHSQSFNATRGGTPVLVSNSR